MKNEQQLKDLSVYRKQVEIIQATAEQIIKDFEIAGEEITFSGNAETAYFELKSQILPIISKIMNNNFQKFLFLLYKIDVSEKELKKISAERKNNFAEIVSEMILERELKKVIVRKYYR